MRDSKIVIDLEKFKDDLAKQENMVRIIQCPRYRTPIVFRLCEDDTIAVSLGYYRICSLDDVFNVFQQYLDESGQNND